MGKVKYVLKRKSIKTKFAVYMLICIVSALMLSLSFSGLCQWGQSKLYQKYEIIFPTSDPGIVIRIDRMKKTHSGDVSAAYQEQMDIIGKFVLLDNIIYNFLGFLSVGLVPLCFIACIAITSVLFYKRNLQRPLDILDNAAGQIADNNLDFNVVYEKEDEMGKLCASFEKMRQALQENNEEMWRQMEERKRLNAAFSHDLRTPLTVLKGQSELLHQYAPKMTVEKVRGTAEMMRKHIARLEEYVKTMGDLQRLEDIEIIRKDINTEMFGRQLLEIGRSVCSDKEFSCEFMKGMDRLYADDAIVLRVFENLLANAVRFAKKKITVSIDSHDGYLYLTVSDDGTGFAMTDLENATKPFYKAVRETDNEHFGMGLNICKILCEKHGGYIRLGNQNGAVVTAVFKQ